jgi:hypothetical protein
MELVLGFAANTTLDDEQCITLGTHLGALLFAMHNTSQLYIEQYLTQAGDKDNLLRHILDDNAAHVMRVLSKEPNIGTLAKAQEALAYLQGKRTLLNRQRTLTHTDLNLSNILIDKAGRVQGLVDWGSFGFSNPSLAMYQLATRPRLWVHIKRKYEALGGLILDDILYAAATIHLAWAPIICKELGLPLAKDDDQEMLERMYANFCDSRLA